MADSYEIRTVTDFLQVPEDRLNACLADFVDHLILCRHSEDINSTLSAMLPAGSSVEYEAHIGRRLKKNEIVHHKDGNRANNQIGNLELMTRSEHARHHALENYPKRKRKLNGTFS